MQSKLIRCCLFGNFDCL